MFEAGNGLRLTSFDAGRFHVADTILVFFFDKHNYLDVPQSVHSNLNKNERFNKRNVFSFAYEIV